MKNFKCVECQNDISKKDFFKEAFDIDDFFLNKNKNFICKNCGAEYEITTFYKVLTVALRLFILLPFSFFCSFICFFLSYKLSYFR
ncbi:hypothetical protein CBLAS_0354 [Campylobacter blaseri]|uniref:Uncharacterized protein n=1 Tax=Campylobacter blaseri TaxID=2042961 RepID=A0A2P8R1I6_9BACT|nr:hypothetical protein [Campylobacter blaseri]PSM52351.1 hypothetical protein CQ405_04680 [Campylobacter blaseri]PSM54117.1 hypothetical protein CRN67_04680 [Campylobacter blaseri]QKF85561.1 hypothetical protein CBLAS_0354 [Campylobacter blaseri]